MPRVMIEFDLDADQLADLLEYLLPASEGSVAPCAAPPVASSPAEPPPERHIDLTIQGEKWLVVEGGCPNHGLEKLLMSQYGGVWCGGLGQGDPCKVRDGKPWQDKSATRA